MTHLTFNGKCISVADNEVHSPLTVGDLLTVLNSIFGNGENFVGSFYFPISESVLVNRYLQCCVGKGDQVY